MQLTVVLFLCVTSFVCVCGKRHRESVTLDISKHQVKACGRKSKSIHDMARNITCGMPREKLVTLEPKSAGVGIYPRQVYLKRCDCEYACGNGHQCVSVMETTKKQWLLVTYNNIHQKCVEVDLPEDMDCQCQCTKTEADCNEEMQEFKQDSCSCVCKEGEMYEKECLKLKRTWDAERCICECPNKMRRCATGYTWSLEYCNCVKVEMYMKDGIPERPKIQGDDL